MAGRVSIVAVHQGLHTTQLSSCCEMQTTNFLHFMLCSTSKATWSASDIPA